MSVSNQATSRVYYLLTDTVVVGTFVTVTSNHLMAII